MDRDIETTKHSDVLKGISDKDTGFCITTQYTVMATSKPSSWADVATKGHYREQRRRIEQQAQNNAAEVEVTEKCTDPIVKPYTTGTEKSKSHGLMVTLGKCAPKGKGKSPQPTNGTSETNHEGLHRTQVQLTDFMEPKLNQYEKTNVGHTSGDDSPNDYQRAIEEMFQHVQDSHNVTSQQFYGETPEVELDLEKEFPALGNTDNSDGIVLGSSSFYKMKRSAERAKQCDESHKRVLKLYDGSLYFGDEANIRSYDLKKNVDKQVEEVDNYQVTSTAHLSKVDDEDYDRPEWEIKDAFHKPNIDDVRPASPKETPEASHESKSIKCDSDEVEEIKGFSHNVASDIDENDQNVDSIEGEPIWGIDSSLVDTPRCVFDLTVLPESWLTSDLQGWIPEDKVQQKTQSDTQQSKAQIASTPDSHQQNLEVDYKESSEKMKEGYQNTVMESHSETEKQESGIESNTEITSDNDHCDKLFGGKHHPVGSTDDSNRSSPPSESNASSDSEDESRSPSGPPSITDFNYDTDDLTGTQGTWGSRCPSPEPDENTFSFVIPTTADLRNNITCSNNEENKLNEPKKDINAEGVMEDKNSEAAGMTLDKEDCDKSSISISDNETGEHIDITKEDHGDLTKGNESNADVEKTPITVPVKEREPAVVDIKCAEKQKTLPINSLRDQSPERSGVKTFPSRKKIDSSSGPSREVSPRRQKQAHAYISSSNSDSVDTTKNVEILTMVSTSPKPVRKKKRRLLGKRKPEIIEKKVETPETKPEVTETTAEEITTPYNIPSMTLKNMTRLPLSEIIAIGKSMDLKKSSFTSTLFQDKKETVAQNVKATPDSHLKLLIPNKPKCDRGAVPEASPERADDYSTWDNLGWNPFDAVDQKEMAFILPHQQLVSEVITKNDAPSVEDTQSDTDSGHWTGAHEERSSYRSSPGMSNCTPSREVDRLSVQSEDTLDGETNSSSCESANNNNVQASNITNNATTDRNNQQIPYPFPNAMPPTSSMPNMEQQRWFYMAMQCMAQQYMTQQMQLMTSQMQQSCSFNPWMVPNQHTGNPMAQFQYPTGMANQIPTQMAGAVGSHMQPGMVNLNPSHYTISTQPGTEAVSQMSSGMGLMNGGQPCNFTPGTYYEPHQPSSTNITNILNAIKPSVIMANPGTSITVTRPGKNSLSPYTQRNPVPLNQNFNDSVNQSTTHVITDDLVCSNAKEKCVESNKQKDYPTIEKQHVRAISGKRCDVIKVSSLMKEDEEKEDEGDDNVAENELEQVTEEEEEDEEEEIENEKTEEEKMEKEEEPFDEETFEETYEEPATPLSSNNKNNKRSGFRKKNSRCKGLRKSFISHSAKLVVVFQTLLILGVSIILYQLLDGWKSSRFR